VIHEQARLFHAEYQHDCCRVVLKPPPPARGRERIPRLWARIRRRQVGEPYECGQWCGHPGDCTWWTPGGYLPPPLITPIDWLAARVRSRWPWQRCPLCGAWATGSDACPTLVVYGDAENAERDEIRWEFGPCGCEGREIVDDGAAPGSE